MQCKHCRVCQHSIASWVCPSSTSAKPAAPEGVFQCACRGSVGFVQLARDTVTGSAVAIKFVEREHPSLAAGLLLREIGNQVTDLTRLPACFLARLEASASPIK